MSIDRLIAVRFPLAAKQKCTPTGARRAIVASVIVVLGIDLHVFFVYKQKEGLLIFILRIFLPNFMGVARILRGGRFL
jgi:hypothetical protein